jgi:crotonobetainyl-CoA:carnitine CoA-transferase CaiB-like acyl-CoA transferase
MAGPLEDIRVLDWTQWQMGTVATAMLADFGAEVIHIENRQTGDHGRALMSGIMENLPNGRNAYFETNNRGKKSLAIDIRKEQGKEIIYRMVQNSDVFVHNFRQGVPEKLKMDYDTLCQYNPKLVYAAASGYGPRGPEAEEPAFDMIGLARSGIASVIGDENNPNFPFHGGLADQIGAIMTSYGILLALLIRERHGIGQKVDVSHLGSMMALEGLVIGMGLYLRPEQKPEDMPENVTRKNAANPLWNYYKCKDGKWLVLGMLQPDIKWSAICKALGIEHLENDSRYANAIVRRENSEGLIAVMDEIFITKTSEEWMKILKETGDIICTPVQGIIDLVNDPQVLANNYIIERNHEVIGPVRVRGIPVELSKTPGEVKVEAPEFGQHTEEVLMEIGGYSWEDIARLREEEVI